MVDFDAVYVIGLLETTRVSWANYFFFQSKNWPEKRGKTSFLRGRQRNYEQDSIGTGRGPQRSNQNMAPIYNGPLKAM